MIYMDLGQVGQVGQVSEIPSSARKLLRSAEQRRGLGLLVRCQVLEGKDGQELKPFQT